MVYTNFSESEHFLVFLEMIEVLDISSCMGIV